MKILITILVLFFSFSIQAYEKKLYCKTSTGNIYETPGIPPPRGLTVEYYNKEKICPFSDKEVTREDFLNFKNIASTNDQTQKVETNLFAEVKIYDELSEDFYTGQWGGGEYKKNLYLFRFENEELFLHRSNSYFKIQTKQNKCLRFGNTISIRKCKNSDEFLFNAIIIGQSAGLKGDGSYQPQLSFMLQQVSSDKYLGFKGDGPWNGYIKTKNTENAAVFYARSDLPDFNPCESSKTLYSEAKSEKNFYCSCSRFGRLGDKFSSRYFRILQKIDNSKIFTTLNRNKIGLGDNYCLVALQTYKNFSNLFYNENEISTQVASTTKQNTKKTETKTQTKTQTKKQTQTKQTTNTINTDGYNDCILENMKNISSDEAAIAIKEACKSKYSSNSSQATSSVDSDFNKDPILIADIPKNLNACGSTTKTRFPIFTGC